MQHLKLKCVAGLALLFSGLAVMAWLSFKAVNKPAPSSANSSQLNKSPQTQPPEAQSSAITTQSSEQYSLASTAPDLSVGSNEIRPAGCLMPYKSILGSQSSPRQLAQRYQLAASHVNAQLAGSSDAELLVVAAMHEEDPLEGLAMATKAVALAPENAAVLWNAVMGCDDPNLCPALEWLQQLSELDSENADVWMSLAVEQLRLGDESSALASLERAATANSANIYFADTLEMNVRAFNAAGSDLPFHLMAGYALELSNQKLPQYLGYANMCRDLGDDNATAAQHCLNFAVQSQADASSRMVQNFASDIEASALDQMGYGQQAESLREQNQQAIAISTEAHYGSAQQVADIQAYITHSPENLESYTNSYRSHGELEAWRRIDQERVAFEQRYLEENCHSMTLGDLGSSAVY